MVVDSLFSLADISSATPGKWVNCKYFTRITGISTDSRDINKDSMFLALRGDTFDGHKFCAEAIASGASVICVDNSYDSLEGKTPTYVVEDTLRAYQDIANFHRRRMKNVKLIAITGSNGKTSTKEMLRSIMEQVYGPERILATKANTNNHIGVPQNILRLNNNHKFSIIEMGTNHPGEIETLAKIAEPDIAVITSIGNAHLEFFHTLDAIAMEKSSLFKFVPKKSYVIYPSDCDQAEIIQQSIKSKYITFGESDNCNIICNYHGGNINGSSFTLSGESFSAPLSVNWSIPGHHQALNAAASTAVGIIFGATSDNISRGLQSCNLPGMRLRVREHNGTHWINDAYNSNLDSLKAGLRWLSEFTPPDKSVIILGDILELGEHSPATHKEVVEAAIKMFPYGRFIFVGEAMSNACKELNIAQQNISLFLKSEDAISKTVKTVKPGDYVYLKASRGMKLEVVEPE